MDHLITGGGGFVGAALARELVTRGRSVRCLDVSGFARLDDLRGHPRLELLEGDACDPETIDAAVAAARSVIHAAAVVGVDIYVQDPARVLDVNMGSLRTVAEACLRRDRPMLFTSSSEVYGRTPWDLGEDAGTVLGSLSRSRWCYALSKAVGEQYLYAFARKGLRFVAVRYFNVYGPRMDAPGTGRVMSKFLGYLQAGEPLPLVDGGEAVRAFCYIDDAVSATLTLFDILETSGEVAGRAFNVGRDEPVTIRQLAARVVHLAGHEPGTTDVTGEEFFGAGFEEIPRRVPRFDALREAAGFQAHVSLDDGLRRTLAWWKLLADPDGPGGRLPGREPVSLIRPRIEPDARLVGAMINLLHSGQVTNNGPELRALESELGEWLHVEEPVVVSSGSAAMSLAAAALGRSGKAVLPSFTYIATLNAVVHAGLEPVFCDIEPDTFTMAPGHLAELFERHDDIGLVLPVNVYGVHPDLDAIGQLCRAGGADVLYDNAHGMGAELAGSRSPAGAQVSIVSLHGTKICPAVEGGAVISDDADLLAEMRRLRTHGLAADMLKSTPGFNLKMSELHAAVGRHSLSELAGAVGRRRDYGARLRGWLSDRCEGAWQVQRVPDDQRSNFQFLGALWKRADRHPVPAVIDAMARHGVQGRRFFWPPLHRLAIHDGRFELPSTDKVIEELICLPVHNRMDMDTLSRVATAVHSVALELA